MPGRPGKARQRRALSASLASTGSGGRAGGWKPGSPSARRRRRRGFPATFLPGWQLRCVSRLKESPTEFSRVQLPGAAAPNSFPKRFWDRHVDGREGVLRCSPLSSLQLQRCKIQAGVAGRESAVLQTAEKDKREAPSVSATPDCQDYAGIGGFPWKAGLYRPMELPSGADLLLLSQTGVKSKVGG